MKTTRILSAAFIAAALVGCSQEEQFNMNQDGQMQFIGSFEQVASRVTMDSNYDLNWEGNEQVSIFPGMTVNNQYQVSSVTGGRASFSFVDYVTPENGYAPTNANYALYPYAADNSIVADGTMTASVPAEFTYDGMENSIKTALMAAKSDDGDGNLSFKNVQGILRLKLNAVQPFLWGAVESIQLKSATQNLSGKVNIKFDGEYPVAAWGEGGKVLTLGLSEAYQKDLESLGSYSEFYLPMVPAEFEAGDVTLTINWANGTEYEVEVPIDFNIERRKIYTLAHTLKGGTSFEGDLEGDIENPIFVATIAELQDAIDNATGDAVINIAAEITGNAVVPQKENVNITILGQGFKFNGMITVDGKSAAYPTAGLTIKDLNFAAENISGDACIRLGDGTNATRYTSNVTVENCTFDALDKVGIKSYTGGDKNLIIKGCKATDKAHSLVQAAGIEGILIKECEIYSKNGMNFNNSNNVAIEDCTAEVRGYAARFGQGSSSATGASEAYSIKNSTLKSACEEAGDAVIILRGSADNATLTIESTTIEGTPGIANNAVGAKVIIDGENAITSLAELQALIDNDETDITLDTDIMGTVVMKSGVTINGNGYQLGSVNLNGADNVTLQNIVFDAANAVLGYDNNNAAKQYANIITGDNTNKKNKGSHNLMIKGCTFTGTFAKGGTSIAFTDYKRTSGFSGNITIKGCTFDTKNAYYNIYGHYTGDSTNGHGDFVIEGNTFKTTFTQGGAIFLGRYASSTPVVVKDNTFETVTSLDEAMYVQDHSNYGVSVNDSNNTFAN